MKQGSKQIFDPSNFSLLCHAIEKTNSKNVLYELTCVLRTLAEQDNDLVN